MHSFRIHFIWIGLILLFEYLLVKLVLKVFVCLFDWCSQGWHFGGRSEIVLSRLCCNTAINK